MKTQLLKSTEHKHAAEILKKGGLVAIPTETVYGLAGNATNPEAVSKIFEAKERPKFDPLIVHLSEKYLSDPLLQLSQDGLIDLGLISSDVKPLIQTLIKNFWPGPLTLLLPRGKKIPDLVTSGLPLVGLRMPQHPLTQKLLSELNFPLAAPSANRFGKISPTQAQAVMQELDGRIDAVLDGGPCQVGVESTVVQIISPHEIQILRPGGITQENLQKTTQVQISQAQPKTADHKISAPGMLDSHYAPDKPFFMLPSSWENLSFEKFDKIKKLLQKNQNPSGWLIFWGDEQREKEHLERRLGLPVIVKTLSPIKENWTEAAQNLFLCLRELQDSQAQILFTEPCPSQTGLGHAISDRLQRATAQWKSIWREGA